MGGVGRGIKWLTKPESYFFLTFKLKKMIFWGMGFFDRTLTSNKLLTLCKEQSTLEDNTFAPHKIIPNVFFTSYSPQIIKKATV